MFLFCFSFLFHNDLQDPAVLDLFTVCVMKAKQGKLKICFNTHAGAVLCDMSEQALLTMTHLLLIKMMSHRFQDLIG